jgi:spore maturation protein CgeB
MRVAIVNTLYEAIVDHVYASDPALVRRAYADQLAAIYAVGAAHADFQVTNLRALGHEVAEFFVNVEPLQRTWAREVGLAVSPPHDRAAGQIDRVRRRALRDMRRWLGLGPKTRDHGWEFEVPREQIRTFKPDVILNCSLNTFPGWFLRELKNPRAFLVGQCSYSIPWGTIDLGPYDLLVSADPAYIERFRQRSKRADYLPHAFETTILDRLGPAPAAPETGVCFVGSLTSEHLDRLGLLERIAARVSMTCWVRGGEIVPEGSPLKATLRPPVWGYDMYRVLRNSRVVLNRHVDFALGVAANIRLYETTGVGTLLLTDHANNLGELFEGGRECAVYRDADECVRLIEHYLRHEDQRRQVAAAGQARTLRQHTFRQRMQRLIQLVEGAA